MTIANRLPLVQPERAPKKWNHRGWGKLEDPCHKSQISTLIGEYSCTKQFQYDRQRECDGESRETCSGKTEMGTASHDVIRRALLNEQVRRGLLEGTTFPSRESIAKVLDVEFANATQGREVVWYGKAEYDDTREDVLSMIDGLFHDLHRHVAEVLACENGFIAKLGDVWTEGHIDLVYRPRSNPLALAYTDWKTGAQRPHQLDLDHGYESGLYAAALKNGIFLDPDVVEAWRIASFAYAQGETSIELPPIDKADVKALSEARDDRQAMHIALRGVAKRVDRGDPLPEGARVFGEFPEVARLTHLPDYKPYEKKQKKKVERPEEIEFWSRIAETKPEVFDGETVNAEKGMWRGPAWYRVRRSEMDVRRTEALLKKLVGWVRMGMFVESVGEKCSRCSYRGPCLTSGYEARGDEAKELAGALRGLDAANAASLSVDDD